MIAKKKPPTACPVSADREQCDDCKRWYPEDSLSKGINYWATCQECWECQGPESHEGNQYPDII